MDFFVIKVKHEGSMRRITAQKPLDPLTQPLPFSFVGLQHTVRRLFSLPASRDNGIVLTYEDADGDVVTICSDADIADALLHQRLNPLRLHLSVNSRCVQPCALEGACVNPSENTASPAAATTTPPAGAAAGAAATAADAVAVPVADAPAAIASEITHAAPVAAVSATVTVASKNATAAAAATTPSSPEQGKILPSSSIRCLRRDTETLSLPSNANLDVEFLRELIAEVKRDLSDEKVKAAARAFSHSAVGTVGAAKEVVRELVDAEDKAGEVERASGQGLVVPEFVVDLAKKLKEACGEFAEDMRSKALPGSGVMSRDGVVRTVEELKEGIRQLALCFGQFGRQSLTFFHGLRS